MPRWEYTTLGIDQRGGRARLRDGEPIPDWQTGPTLEVMLNQLGEKGRELVGFEARDGLTFTLYIFKRPKQGRGRMGQERRGGTSP